MVSRLVCTVVGGRAKEFVTLTPEMLQRRVTEEQVQHLYRKLDKAERRGDRKEIRMLRARIRSMIPESVHRLLGPSSGGSGSHGSIRPPCPHCHVRHPAGQHRFHGYGSYRRTHG